MPPGTNAEQKAREALTSNPFPQTPWVNVTEEGIVIATGYSEALQRLLRWVPKAKWRTTQRSWLIPFSGAEAVRAVLPEISRLADAAQELEPAAADPVKTKTIEADPLACLTEAAFNLYGADWQAALAGEFASAPVTEWMANRRPIDPADAIFPALAARLRGKAKSLNQAADRLDASFDPSPRAKQQ
jgi:hypothetical protein